LYRSHSVVREDDRVQNALRKREKEVQKIFAVPRNGSYSGCVKRAISIPFKKGLQMTTHFALPQKMMLAFLVITLSARGQTVPPLDKIQSQQELDRAISTLDAELFDAYNKCDLKKFSSFFVDDVEFYHDQGGVTLGNAKLTESIEKNICGGDVRRELVPGTLEAHYMKGYGAVEIGVHRFYHPKSNTPAGEGRFISLWQYKDGAWKITRAISFDHHQAQAAK
jgi:ketosteroid isomerase-like protein